MKADIDKNQFQVLNDLHYRKSLPLKAWFAAAAKKYCIVLLMIQSYSLGGCIGGGGGG